MAGALTLLGAANFARWHWELVTGPSYDFDLNWVAAHQLVDREPLYDRDASRALGVQIVGPEFAPLNVGTYTSFIGTPATALLYVPFTAFSHDTAITVYRWVQAAMMVGAIAITAHALPRRWRLPAGMVGVAAFLWSFPVAMSIGLGQVDGFIMLAIGVAVWASVRDRWPLAGAALGIAALLKISPGALLVYLVVRGRRQVLLPALAAAGSLLAVAAAVGRPRDLGTWLTDTLPDVAKGGFFTNNVSIPAALARAFGSNHDWLSYDHELGRWGLLSWLVMAGGIGAVYVLCRRRGFEPLELGAVVLVALLAGPVTWDMYLTWALLTLVLVADPRCWERRPRREVVALAAVVVAAIAVLRRWTPYPSPAEVDGDWFLRVETAAPTLAVLSLLAVVLRLLTPPGARRNREDDAEHGDEEAAPEHSGGRDRAPESAAT